MMNGLYPDGMAVSVPSGYFYEIGADDKAGTSL